MKIMTCLKKWWEHIKGYKSQHEEGATGEDWNHLSSRIFTDSNKMLSIKGKIGNHKFKLTINTTIHIDK